MRRAPLPFCQDDWRFRWLTLDSWNRLHRVAELVEPSELSQLACGWGFTVCDQQGMLHVPGLLSRMSLLRCAWCCQAMGIPRGLGSPYNAELWEPGDDPAVASGEIRA